MHYLAYCRPVSCSGIDCFGSDFPTIMLNLKKICILGRQECLSHHSVTLCLLQKLRLSFLMKGGPCTMTEKKTKAILALWALFHVFVLISELGFLYSTEYEDENDDIVNSSVVKAPLGSKYIRLPFKMISNIYFLIRKG